MPVNTQRQTQLGRQPCRHPGQARQIAVGIEQHGKFVTAQSGDDAWNYASVLKIYQRIEDWNGPADPERRGKGGQVYVEPAQSPKPTAT